MYGNVLIKLQEIIAMELIKLQIFMKQTTKNLIKKNCKQQAKRFQMSEMDKSFVILKFIQPARQVLQSSNKTNCVYKKQLNSIPTVLKCSEQLYPLGKNNNQPLFNYDPESTINIYKRDLTLKINPYETRNYFRTPNPSISKSKIQRTNRSQQYQLKFDSHFESGNLLSVNKQILNHNYHLLMQNDINTFGCTQWFFFRVYNKDPLKVTFFINNFYKNKSLYSNGMKILIFSMKKFINQQIGWIRGGEQISYFRNRMQEKKDNDAQSKKFYSLKFSYHFQYDQDEVYFAYHYPYTYSRLNHYLMMKQHSRRSYYNCRTLCKTVAENKIYMITITDNSIPKQKKNSIFLTSRVHPGETVSSLMIEGVIDFLTSDNQIAKSLRQSFVFKIFPMLNPDGVVHGNYRTNIAGIDLNRVWDHADKELSPEVYQLKKHIIQFNKQCPVMLFCDLHGHSARKSAFMYGCQKQRQKILDEKQQSRLFPFMLSFQNQDFLYKSCNFNVQKNKRGTARIQLWKELKIPNIFTLQASFCSAQNSDYHFRPNDYSQIGVSFCKTIYEYFLNPNKKKQFYEKLKQQKDFTMKKSSQSEDSQSDNDLFDNRTLSNLKNGMQVQELWQKRRITIQKVNQSATQSLGKKQVPKQRRYTIDRTKKTIKTQPNFEVNLIMAIPSKKIITSSIPTKRLTFDTGATKTIEPKIHLKHSIFQRVQQNYRGKSTVYRIQRKNIRNNTFYDSSKKGSSIFALQNTQDFF